MNVCVKTIMSLLLTSLKVIENASTRVSKDGNLSVTPDSFILKVCAILNNVFAQFQFVWFVDVTNESMAKMDT